MSEQMVITDVSRMNTGACIAGYSLDLSRPIRPVLASGGGFAWDDLCVARGTLLAPFNVIEIELTDPRPDPPHCEDILITEPLNIRYLGRVPEQKVPVALEKNAFDSAQQAFGGRIERSRSILPGEGERSLATIRVNQVDFVGIDVKQDNRALRLRISFRDATNDRYDLPVTDIGFRMLCYDALVRRSEAPGRLGARIREHLNNAGSLYIRIGASRAFLPRPGADERCYLMATGIYSIPDYRRVPWEHLFPDTIPEDQNPLPENVVERILEQHTRRPVKGAFS